MSVPSRDFSQTIPPQTLSRLAQEWLMEDTPNFDLAGVCVGSREVKARLLCKTPGTVLAGCPFFNAVFTQLGCTVEWTHRESQRLGGCDSFLKKVIGTHAKSAMIPSSLHVFDGSSQNGTQPPFHIAHNSISIANLSH